jgi:hypothetical protein
MLLALKVLPSPNWVRRGETYSTEQARANLRLIALETVACRSRYVHGHEDEYEHVLSST